MFLRADQATFTEADIQAVRSLEAEFSEAQKKELEKQLEDQKGGLEVKVFEWIEGQPDFIDPDSDAPEKTPEYMQAAAELLRKLTDDELLLSFADNQCQGKSCRAFEPLGTARLGFFLMYILEFSQCVISKVREYIAVIFIRISSRYILFH